MAGEQVHPERSQSRKAPAKRGKRGSANLKSAAWVGIRPRGKVVLIKGVDF